MGADLLHHRILHGKLYSTAGQSVTVEQSAMDFCFPTTWLTKIVMTVRASKLFMISSREKASLVVGYSHAC